MQNSFKIARLRTFLIFLFVISLQAGLYSYAQTKKTPQQKSATSAADSAARARQQVLDSTRRVQKHTLDSMKTSRMHITDSVKAVRKHTTDSLAAIRKYRESKKYKDSVTNARLSRVNAIRNTQKQHFDSLKAARQKQTDSIVAARKKTTDILHAAQKKRTDSLAVIRKYKESKRFRDSVSISRQLHMDSLRAVRKKFSDSAFASRKNIMDSTKKVRKVYFDSLSNARKKVTDSLKIVRKAKADSLAKVKDLRAKQQKANEKKREDKMKLALELKIKKKHEAWSNDKMLKKKWSLPRQAVQNTFTRYNYFFNANRKMDEALANMQRMAKNNNYDSLIELFPFNPDRDSTVLAPDMDSIIRKVSLGIQIHDPRTKWGDDLYLLMGQAYFYKGSYENATISLRYAISILELYKKKTAQKPVSSKSKEEPSIVEDKKKSMLDFLKHQTVHNESLLWLARVYTQSRHEGEAESVLDLLSADKKFPESLKGRMAVEKAFLDLKQKNTHNATEQLAIVSGDGNVEHWLRLRATYLNGQLLQRQGAFNDAAANFRKVIDMQPKIDMDFYARKYLAYNLMYAGGDQKEAIAALKKLLNDGKYSPYYDQVYFVLGKLAANSNNTDDAITYLGKSIKAPKATKKQKAISFASLGDVYYSVHNYEAAKSAYDSAAILSSHAPGDELVAKAMRRSKSLDEVTGPLHTIHVQDSLLGLSGMSEKEQRSMARKYIRHLEQLRTDSIFKAENAGMNLAAAASSDPNQQDNNYSSWYFTSPTLMQQGLNDFKRKWGNRQLTDNWQRSSAAAFANNSSSTTSTSNNSTAADSAAADPNGGHLTVDENGIPTEESLLTFIPNTTEQKEQTRLRIQRAYIDLANAYVRQLEDYPQALLTMDSLDSKYPNHEHKAQEYYLRYLVALRQNKLPAAQDYSNKLQKEYPESQYTALVKPTEDSPSGSSIQTPVAVYYDETYNLLGQREYASVISRSRTGRNLYSDVRYRNKFTILEASAQAGAENYAAAEALITDFVKDNPADSLRPWAESILSYIAKNKPVPPPAPATTANSNNLGNGPVHPLPPGNATPTANTPATANNGQSPAANTTTPPAPAAPGAGTTANNIPTSYTYKPQEEHYFVFAFAQMDSKAMGVKAALTDMNSIKFSSLGLATTLEMLQGQQGLIITRSFQNLGQARVYMNAFKGAPQITREYTNTADYDVFMISAKNLQKLQADHSLADYLQFYKKQYK